MFICFVFQKKITQNDKKLVIGRLHVDVFLMEKLKLKS